MNEQLNQASMPLIKKQSLFSRGQEYLLSASIIQKTLTQKHIDFEEEKMNQQLFRLPHNESCDEISNHLQIESPVSLQRETSNVNTDMSQRDNQSLGEAGFSSQMSNSFRETYASREDNMTQEDEVDEDQELTYRRTINQFCVPIGMFESSQEAHGILRPSSTMFKTGESTHNSNYSISALPGTLDVNVPQNLTDVIDAQKSIYYRIQEDGKVEQSQIFQIVLNQSLTKNEIQKILLKDYFGNLSMSNFITSQIRVKIDEAFKLLDDEVNLKSLISYEFILHVKPKPNNLPTLTDLAHDVRQIDIKEKQNKKEIDQLKKTLEQEKKALQKKIHQQQHDIDKLKERHQLLRKQASRDREQLSPDILSFHSQIKQQRNDENQVLEAEILRVRQQHIKMAEQIKQMKELLLQNNINLPTICDSSQSLDSGELENIALLGGNCKQSLQKAHSKQEMSKQNLQFKQQNIRDLTKSQIQKNKTEKYYKKSKYDMAFMFANPIIKEDINNPKQMIETYMPLDLEKEYLDIKESICNESKKFTIKKIAINSNSLSDALIDNPKIVHISCHGDYSKKLGSFYLAFEKEQNGEETQFTETQMSEIMTAANGHQIKLVFINACHSGKMGEIFFKAGVPVVVCVDQGEEIDDECCKIFSQRFYQSLVKGQSIRHSFIQAKTQIAVNNKFSPCCCTHSHTEECWWFKLYKDDQEEAHQLHSGHCQCNQKNRKHGIFCKHFKKFEERKLEQQRKEQNKNQKKETSSRIKEKAGNKMLTAFFAGIDDGDDELDSDGNDEQTQDRMMCCCKPHLIHDESLKFQLLYNEELGTGQKQPLIIRSKAITKKQAQECQKLIEKKGLADKDNADEIKMEDLQNVVEEIGKIWTRVEDLVFVDAFQKVNFKQFFIAAVKGYSILDNLIFENLQDGYVEEKHEKQQNIPKITYNKDSDIELLGRHIEIHELLKYLSGKQENQGQVLEKIQIIHDKDHNCSLPISRFCVQYLQNRNKFQHGGYFLDMENEKKSENIYKSLCNKIQINILGGVEDFVKHAQDLNCCLIIANCDKIIENDLDQFTKDLNKLVEAKQLKVIILTQRNKLIDFSSHYKIYIKQIQMKNIEKNYQQKLFLKLTQNNKHTKMQNITWDNIKSHKLFNEFDFTVDQIMEMCNGDKQLDELYPQQKYLKEQEGKNDQEVAKIRLEYIQKKSNYQTIKQILYVLTFLPSGMTLSDITQLNNLQPQGFTYLQPYQLIDFFQEFDEKDKKKSRKQFLKLGYEQGKISKISLEQSIRQYIFSEIIKKQKEKSEIIQIQDIILGFLSKQLRAQVLGIGTMNNFDLYVLSCKINSDLWKSPQSKEEAENSENFEDLIIEDQDKYCDAWLPNIEFILELFEEMFFDKEQNKNIENYFSEIILCTTSIMIERNMYDNALELIEKGHKICDQYVFEKIKIKLLLIRASINIIRQKPQSSRREIEKELKSIEDMYTKRFFSLISGEINYLRAVNGIIQLEEIQQNGIFENSIDVQPLLIVQKSKTFNSEEKKQKIRNSILFHSNEQYTFNRNFERLTKENKEKFDKQYQQIASNFIYSMDQFKYHKQTIGNAKATFLRTQFIIDYSDQETIEREARMICTQLMQIQDDLFKNKNYQMIAESYIIQSQLNLVMGQEYYQSALKFAKIAKKFLNEYDIEQTELQRTAHHLVAISSKNLKEKQKNLFVIASSMPIKEINQQVNCFKNISCKFQNDITQAMKKSKKQIDYKVEILNEKFLKKIESCQVLHLRPQVHIQNYTESIDFVSLEDREFKLVHADIKQLENELKKNTEDSLKISLLILEIPNCEEIAKFFLNEIKVDHVIYFKVEDKDNVDETEISRDLHQIKNDRVETFMQQVILQLYKLIFSQGAIKSIKDMVNECNSTVEKTMDIYDDLFKIHAVYAQQNGGNEFLYDKEALNEQLEIGGVFDLSPIRTYCQHTQKKLFMMPIFEMGSYQRFQEMMNLLVSSKNRIVNIHGHNGLYSKKLLNEVSNYLRMRQFFPKGIYWLHTNSSSFHKDLKKMFNDLRQEKQEKLKHEFKPKNKIMNDQELSDEDEFDNSQDENCLIIINEEQSQNLGEKALMTNIKSIQKQIENYVLILISEDQVTIPLQNDIDAGEQVNFKVKHLTDQEMSLYFKCLMNSYSLLDSSLKTSFYDRSSSSIACKLISINYVHIYEKVICNIQGNISVLQLMCFIVFSQYNNVELIKIEHKEQVEHKIIFENKQPQEVSLQILNFIEESDRRIFRSKSIMQNQNMQEMLFGFLIQQDSEVVISEPENSLQIQPSMFSRHKTMTCQHNKVHSILKRKNTLGFQKRNNNQIIVDNISVSQIDTISEESKENNSSDIDVNKEIADSIMESQQIGSESSDKNDEKSISFEAQNFIQDNNSRDGCVRYHDIYVRAVSWDENTKLFIFMKNYEGDEFQPKFKIYKKINDKQLKQKNLVKLTQENYKLVDTKEVKEIIIYVKAPKEEKQPQDD